jgi:hypothetical protein
MNSMNGKIKFVQENIRRLTRMIEKMTTQNHLCG